MIRDPKIGEVVFALPFIHLIMVSLFMYGYCGGFGGDLAKFTSPADLFGISIADIAAIYTMGLVYFIPIYIIFNIEKFSRKNKVTIGSKSKKIRRAKVLCLGIACLMIAVILTYITVVEKIKSGHAIIILCVYILTSAFTVTSTELLKRSGLNRWTQVGISTVVACFMAALVTGLVQGEYQRAGKVTLVAYGHPICDGNIVLRELDERFLMIRPDGLRVLGDGTCKTLLVFPQRDYEPWPSWWPKKYRIYIPLF